MNNSIIEPFINNNINTSVVNNNTSVINNSIIKPFINNFNNSVVNNIIHNGSNNSMINNNTTNDDFITLVDYEKYYVDKNETDEILNISEHNLKEEGKNINSGDKKLINLFSEIPNGVFWDKKVFYRAINDGSEKLFKIVNNKIIKDSYIDYLNAKKDFNNIIDLKSISLNNCLILYEIIKNDINYLTKYSENKRIKRAAYHKKHGKSFKNRKEIPIKLKIILSNNNITSKSFTRKRSAFMLDNFKTLLHIKLYSLQCLLKKEIDIKKKIKEIQLEVNKISIEEIIRITIEKERERIKNILREKLNNLVDSL
jgi:hypothetical protein